MKSFTDYLQHKNIDSLMSEIAHKMVELNVDPWSFLMEYYKNEPTIIVALESHKELNENLWGGLKRFFGGAGGDIARGLGSDAYNAAKAFGGNVKDAAKQARAAVAGPEAHYAASIEALQGLSKELNKNQAVQSAMQTNPEVKQLVGSLQGILKQLNQQKEKVALITRQAGTTNVQNVPGGIPGSQPQQQQQQQPQQNIGATMGNRMAAGAYQAPQTQPFVPSGNILGSSGQPITAANYAP